MSDASEFRPAEAETSGAVDVPSSGDTGGADQPDTVQFDEIPVDQREEAEKMLVTSMRMMGISFKEDGIANKVTEEHITKMLDSDAEEMRLSYRYKNFQRIFVGIGAVLVMMFVGFIVIALKDKPEIMEKVLYTVVGAILGAFGGYGFGSKKKDNEK